MFFKRNYQQEMMDDFSIDDGRIDAALKELRIINKYLGGNSVTKKGLQKIFSRIPHKNSIKILDAGGGASDILLSFKGMNLKIFSADLNRHITKYVKQNSPEVGIVCANVFMLPYKQKQFDVVHLSLFLHHFKEDEIKKILLHLEQLTKYGMIINDLQRSLFAFLGIKILTILFSKSKFVKNDGPLSVKRGFKKNELVKILDELRFNYEIKYKWAFRWMVVIYL